MGVIFVSLSLFLSLVSYNDILLDTWTVESVIGLILMSLNIIDYITLSYLIVFLLYSIFSVTEYDCSFQFSAMSFSLT